MLDSLTNRLTGIFDRLRGYGRLSEENIVEALREVRLALLEADVNFKVVKGFVDRVREKAIGQDVLKSLTPGQQVVKVVRDELVELLGGSGHRLAMAPHPPTVIMLIGLQGSGKTTSAAKLARYFQKQGQHPVLAAADIYRPGCHRPAPDPGSPAGCPRAGRAGAEAARHLRGSSRGRGQARALAAHPGHRRTAAYRRGDAGRAPRHQAGARASPRASRGGRHDRPGRGRRGREVQRGRRHRCRDPHQAGRRCPGGRGALGALRDRTPDRFRRDRGKD